LLKSSLNLKEVEKFSELAGQWWNSDGPFRHLHLMNPARLEFIRDSAGGVDGKKLLDVGCGGGLAALPLAKMGAAVTAIDASSDNIEAAKVYCKDYAVEVDFRCGLLENMVGKYDIITCLEIVEHVEDPAFFLQSAVSLLNDGGVLIISTINRTIKSYLGAIVIAEYVLSMAPKGTHDWNKFLTPDELCELMPTMKLQQLNGMKYFPLSAQWRLIESSDVNYIAAFKAEIKND
jgi:2-polyprenyl-6-hydroxyphenyl methylase/3-demethylubiquinone-9 3-methyltransferase